MKKYLSYIVALTIILIGLSSCHTSAPRLDYKALAQASVRLGVDIELQDNHKLYILSLIHISEPTRQAEISYAVFCLKKKKQKTDHHHRTREPNNTQRNKQT